MIANYFRSLEHVSVVVKTPVARDVKTVLKASTVIHSEEYLVDLVNALVEESIIQKAVFFIRLLECNVIVN